MTKEIYVIGHKNPDTDSICSAIAYANLKRLTGSENYIACRAGDINRETAFVLNYFGVAAPALLDDIRSRVEDLLMGGIITVLPSTTLHEVGLLTHNRHAKTIAVVDTNNILQGIITLGDIAERYMNDLSLGNLANMEVDFAAIARTLNGRFLVEAPENCKPDGNVVIATMSHDTIGGFIKPGDAVIIGDREKAQVAALDAGADCLIVTGGFMVSEEVKKKAQILNIPVISVPYDSFATARLINMCTPISSLMKTEEIIAFQVDDLLEEAKKVMLETRFRNYPVIDENNKFLGMVSRYNLLALMNKKVVLVDHNEKNQAVEGIEKADILEIIDHHRVGDLQTGEPIYFRNEPVGCTATIVAGMYMERELNIEPSMAGLMLAAILSDTVIFKSPTCTERDKEVAEKLATIADVDLMLFGQEMFKAGTSLTGRTPEEILFADFKEFHLGKITAGIGQVSTMDIESVIDIKESLFKAMEDKRRDKGYYYVLLMVTDILYEGTNLLVAGEDVASLKKALGVDFKDKEAFLAGVMSRKKQIVPPLSRVFNE